MIEYLSYKKPIISLESKPNTELNWPFLIKVDYKTDTTVKFLENFFDNKIAVSFNGYDDIIKNYDINKIGGQYMNLILTQQNENKEEKSRIFGNSIHRG